MGDDERFARERLEGLNAPAPRPGFHDELWERVQAAEHAAARRWRLTSIALAVVAIAAIAAATALAAALNTSSGKSVIDRTYSCVASPSGGLPSVLIAAYVTTLKYPGSFDVGTNPDTSPGDNEAFYLDWGALKNRLIVDPTGCSPVKRSVPLKPRGLPSNGVMTSTFAGGFYDTCNTTARIDVHLRITASGGVATSAQFAVQNERGGHPVAFVSWAPHREDTYLSSHCREFR
jgi:hypothetical protein